MTHEEKTEFLLTVFAYPQINAMLVEIANLSKENSDNTFLSGSWALHLHGLNVGDLSSSDIDLIIYNPTRNQFRMLEKLRDYTLFSNRNALELKKKFKDPNGKAIFDIIEGAFVDTKALLFYKFSEDLVLPISSISDVIKVRKRYGKIKYIESNQFLKENNF